MMFLLTTAFALSVLGFFANAQPIDNTALGISTIEADFKTFDLVPDLLPSFNPSALMTVDARAVGTNESNGQILHWLTNFATLQNNSSPPPSLNVSGAGGLVVTNYVSPQPPVGTGLHRYVILLFSQPPSFSPPANLSSPNVGIDLYFHLTDYISSSNLGKPIAGMFFEVQGPANVTSSATVSGSAS